MGKKGDDCGGSVSTSHSPLYAHLVEGRSTDCNTGLYRDQSIYGFRAAEIKNLKRMQVAYPETLVVVLEENYRSSASILQSAQVVIEQDESRPNKMLLPTHSPGTRPVLRYLKDTAQEAQWIVLELKRVMAMTGNAITPNDVAILVRSAAQTRHIEGALAQNGIAYKMAGGLRFFDRVEVKTVLDYLRVIHNPGNNDALARVVNVPPRKVGDTTVKALLEEAFRRKKPLWEVIKGGVRGQLKLETKVLKTAEQGLSGFVNVILTARKMLFEEEKDELEGDGGLELDSVVEGVGQKATLVDIVYYLMKKLNYREYLERHYPEDHDARWANIEELVMQAADFTDTLATTLPEDDDEEALPTIDGIEQAKPAAMADALDRFLANVALVNEVREEEEEEGAAPRERVTISTIHSAKGLEWPVVFIPGCYEGSIPHSRCEDTDEERRLLYVAMTRAQGLLYMSCPKKNNKYEQSALSQFIKNPKVLKLLDKKGPTLTPATAQGVLQILGRVCPEVRVINEVAAGLESLEDDLFPIGDPSESDDEGKEWVDQGRGGKRRRIEGTDEQGGRYTSHGWENQEERRVQSKAQGWGTGVGTRTGSGSGGFMSAKTITTTATSYTSYSAAATTMSASASFSSNTTLMGGFKSARGHLDELRERQLGAEVDVTRQEMRRVHGSFGAKSTTIETTKEVFGKKTEKKVPVKVVKKGPGVGQGNLFNFFSKPSGPAAGNRGGPGKGLSSGKQQSMKSLQVKAKDGFVLLSSSPVKRRSPPPPPSRGIPSSPPPAKDGQTLGNSAVYEAFPVSGPEAPREALMMNDIIPDSDDSEDDPFDSLPPPQAPPPPQPNIPPLIPNSDPASDPTDSDAEEVYREIEALDPQSCEPVLPKPFLTRAGSGNPVLGLGAAPIRLVERGYTATERIVVPEREIAPLFNRAAVRAINQQGVSQQQQQKRTLGIRRSVNGWEARGGRGSGGGGVGGAGSGGSAGSGSRGSGKGGGSGSGSGSGKKGGGFVRHLLG